MNASKNDLEEGKTVSQFIHVEHPVVGLISILVVSWRSREVYFKADTFLSTLGYINPNRTLALLCNDVVRIPSEGGAVTCISKADVKTLIRFSSDPNIAEFSTWLWEEALPHAIKTGHQLLMS